MAQHNRNEIGGGKASGLQLRALGGLSQACGVGVSVIGAARCPFQVHQAIVGFESVQVIAHDFRARLSAECLQHEPVNLAGAGVSVQI
jgi:hypothetical protein